MSAFITNFQSPVEMQDLEDRFRRGGISNLNMLLHWRQFQPLEWTVDKQAVVGDTVLFMCAKTSVDHIGRLYTQIRKAGQKDSALGRFAAAQQALYKKYAGCIVALAALQRNLSKPKRPGGTPHIGEALGMPKLIIFSFWICRFISASSGTLSQ